MFRGILLIMILQIFVGCQSIVGNRHIYHYSSNASFLKLQFTGNKDGEITVKRNAAPAEVHVFTYKKDVGYIIVYEEKTFKKRKIKTIKYFLTGNGINCLLMDNQCLNFSVGMITPFSKDLIFDGVSLKRKQ